MLNQVQTPDQPHGGSPAPQQPRGGQFTFGRIFGGKLEKNPFMGWKIRSAGTFPKASGTVQAGGGTKWIGFIDV